MKRDLKQLLLFATLILILLSAGCNRRITTLPDDYLPGTWISDSPQITFTVDENYQCDGEIVYDGQTYPIIVHFDFVSGIYFFLVDDPAYSFLSGSCTFGPDKMVARITTDNLFGGQYDEIVFVKSEPEPSESSEASVQE